MSAWFDRRKARSILLEQVKRASDVGDAAMAIFNLRISPDTAPTQSQMREAMVDLVVPMLGDDSEVVRGWSAGILGWARFPGESAQAVARLQEDASIFVRDCAIQALASYGGQSLLKPHIIQDRLKHPAIEDPRWWRYARLMAQCGYPINTEVVKQSLRSPKDEVRAHAFDYMNATDEAVSIRLAADMIHDSFVLVRRKAAEVLSTHGGLEHVHLIPVMLQDENWVVRLNGLKWLTRMPDRALFDSAHTAAQAVPNGDSGTTQIRLAAIQALGAIGDPRAVALLKQAALDLDPAISAEARRALQLLGESLGESAWPAYEKEEIGGGNKLQIANKTRSDCRVGIRRDFLGTKYGRDFVVAAGRTDSVFIGFGSYDLFYVFASEPSSVFKGDEAIALKAVENEIAVITIGADERGNYRLRRVG